MMDFAQFLHQLAAHHRMQGMNPQIGLTPGPFGGGLGSGPYTPHLGGGNQDQYGGGGYPPMQVPLGPFGGSLGSGPYTPRLPGGNQNQYGGGGYAEMGGGPTSPLHLNPQNYQGPNLLPGMGTTPYSPGQHFARPSGQMMSNDPRGTGQSSVKPDMGVPMKQRYGG